MRHSDDLRRINVSSTSLKRIRIHADVASVVYFECKVTIDAPNLVYLYIMDEVQSDYSFMVKPLFLVEAYIHSITIYGDQILTNISAAKVLTLTSSASAFDEVDEVFDKFDEIDEFDKINDQNMRIFPNLVKLVTNIRDIRDWRFMIASLVRVAGDPWDQRVHFQLIVKDLVSGLLVYDLPLSSLRKK
nr:F-box/RNI-like/FBD-like domains-containing protein [Tanacetum cinerariifolium]